MDTKKLEALAAAVQYGSFTRAAEKLNMAQPAVSLAIRELEVFYNVRLFERMNRRIYLTEAGRTLRQYADTVLSQMRESVEVLRESGARGTCAFGVHVTLGETRLAEILTEKSRAYGHPIYLISDEPYREIVFSGFQVPWIPQLYPDTIVCYSFSKSLSLPGERLGYVLVPASVTDSREVYAAVAGAGRSLGYVNAPSLFQRVAAACDGLTADLTVYQTNRDLLYHGLTGMGYTCVEPGGTFYLLLQSPEPDAAAFCQRAREYDLLFPPTDDFACPGWCRIAFCTSTKTVQRALPVFERLAKEYGLS